MPAIHARGLETPDDSDESPAKKQSRTASPWNWSPIDEDDPERTVCNGCGSKVNPKFGRVLGDQDGQVHRCPHCATTRQLSHGAVAGVDSNLAYEARGRGQR